MPSANTGKQPMRNDSTTSGEGSSSRSSGTTINLVAGNNGSSAKVATLLAAAPRLSLEDEASLEPPSYDDANSIQSGQLSGRSLAARNDVGFEIDDSLEFDYAFEISNSHDELLTNVVRHPGAKNTVLSLQRLALGSRRVNTQNPMMFKIAAVPLSASQLEVQAKANSEMGIKSIKIGMLDIPDDERDIQSGVIDWPEKGAGATTTWGNLNLPEVFFERAYSMPPEILLFIYSFAFKPNTAHQIKATLLGCNQYGFCAKFTTRGPPVLDAKAMWVAIPKDSPRFDCGMIEVSSKALASKSYFTGSINFTKWKFPKQRPPKVFIGLTGFDQDVTRPFRVSVAVTGQSHEGFSWTIRTWDDALINSTWGASVSWVAIADSGKPAV
ncbi:hypothetical protein TWF696_008583 [Orbilia brochopaga]|uniref:H-type lectin domain-containing protein n=1 Tax=Orbilia brochopaga TaxID=3140254 RepID=A0AAV9UHJ4_9PEZI